MKSRFICWVIFLALTLLMQKTGISVLDRAPDELVLPATRFLQYISPIDVHKRKQDVDNDAPLPQT